MDGHQFQLLELFLGAGPGSALVHVRADDHGGVRQGIDQLVALHCVSDVEACAQIVGRDEHEPLFAHSVTMVGLQRRLL